MLPFRRLFSKTRPHCLRAFTTSPASLGKPLPPRPSIDEGDITEAFLKGTGPGGQKINKTSSAVQLKHLPTGIVIKCQETRSRSQNRKIARRILAERVEHLDLGDQSRVAVKAEREKKKKASKNKKAKRKYRKLAEGKEGGGEDDLEEADLEEDDDEEHDMDADDADAHSQNANDLHAVTTSGSSAAGNAPLQQVQERKTRDDA